MYIRLSDTWFQTVTTWKKGYCGSLGTTSGLIPVSSDNPHLPRLMRAGQRHNGDIEAGWAHDGDPDGPAFYAEPFPRWTSSGPLYELEAHLEWAKYRRWAGLSPTPESVAAMRKMATTVKDNPPNTLWPGRPAEAIRAFESLAGLTER